MATPIYLQAKDIMISDAKTALSCLSDAVSSMSKVEKAVSGWDLYIDAAADGFVFMDSKSEIISCLSVLRAKQDQLESLVSVLQTGTYKIEEADASFKNEITDPSFWEKLLSVVGHALYSSTIGRVNAIFAGVAWLGGLFDGGTHKSKKIEDISPSQTESTSIPALSPSETYTKKMQEYLQEARQEVGQDGTKYWQWYSEREHLSYYWTDGWCAAFASYWMEKAGINIDTPKNDYEWFVTFPEHQMEYFKKARKYYDGASDYSPKTGDLVFLDWDGEVDYPMHVGIIYVDENGTQYIIHGNTGDFGVVSCDIYSPWYRGRTLGFADVASYADSAGVSP